ncbi:MarR family winged helix-turn-helix transcriptional regulator [Kineococcus gynurae]|uniref:MarR family winged helix-turn-helix transcriptional regulator n=1 Tax=Kineococcus gynurae TaxID=452979 RepID=A0ABV5LQX0_9ACTN
MPEPGRTAAAVEAWEALFRLQSTLLRRFEAEDVWGAEGLRGYDVLWTLGRCPQQRARLGELSASVLLPQPSLSRLVDRLAQRGLLRREADPQDGRGVLVVLTEDGARRQREIGGRHAAGIARQLADADPADLTALTDVCRTLTATLP